MIALFKYLFLDYLRSYRYVPPVFIYIIFVIVFYTYTPNPVIDSYAVTSTVLYLVSTWISLSFLTSEPIEQRDITLIHVQKNLRYYLCKIYILLFISLCLTIFSLLYPVIFNMFNEPVSLQVAVISFFVHILLATLGISVTLLLNHQIINSLITSWGSVALVLVLSLSYNGLKQLLPEYLNYILLVLPPFFKLNLNFMNWEGGALNHYFLFSILSTIIYISILITLHLVIMLKKNIK